MPRGLILLSVLFAGCGSDECVKLEPCTPLYAPRYDEVYQRTLAPTCGQGGSACHGPAGPSGLRIGSPDETHRHLIAAGHARPGDAACSPLVVRLASTDAPMPPGMPLAAAERCAIERWIAEGAAR